VVQCNLQTVGSFERLNRPRLKYGTVTRHCDELFYKSSLIPDKRLRFAGAYNRCWGQLVHQDDGRHRRVGMKRLF